MSYSIEAKKFLIVPLSSFIRFNKQIISVQLANLFGKSFNDRIIPFINPTLIFYI
jgi:hypothetical protein